MVWVSLAIAAVAAALAIYLQSIWVGIASLLAIAAAIWDGRSKGMWLAYDFGEHDSNGPSDTGSDGGGGGDGGD